MIHNLCKFIQLWKITPFYNDKVFGLWGSSFFTLLGLYLAIYVTSLVPKRRELADSKNLKILNIFKCTLSAESPVLLGLPNIANIIPEKCLSMAFIWTCRKFSRAANNERSTMSQDERCEGEMQLVRKREFKISTSYDLPWPCAIGELSMISI